MEGNRKEDLISVPLSHLDVIGLFDLGLRSHGADSQHVVVFRFFDHGLSLNGPVLKRIGDSEDEWFARRVEERRSGGRSNRGRLEFRKNRTEHNGTERSSGRVENFIYLPLCRFRSRFIRAPRGPSYSYAHWRVP